MYRTYRVPYKDLANELEYIETNGGEIVKIETIITPDLAYLNNCTYDRSDKHWVMIIVRIPEVDNEKDTSNTVNSFTSSPLFDNNKIVEKTKKVLDEVWDVKEC